MEGLWGTAIRSAVRDPSCPQAPVLPGARRHPVLVRGCSCRWLRPRPPIPALTFTTGDPARRVAHENAGEGLVPEPGSCHRAQQPPDSRTGHPAPISPARSCRSAPGHPPRH